MKPRRKQDGEANAPKQARTPRDRAAESDSAPVLSATASHRRGVLEVGPRRRTDVTARCLVPEALRKVYGTGECCVELSIELCVLEDVFVYAYVCALSKVCFACSDSQERSRCPTANRGVVGRVISGALCCCRGEWHGGEREAYNKVGR